MSVCMSRKYFRRQQFYQYTSDFWNLGILNDTELIKKTYIDKIEGTANIALPYSMACWHLGLNDFEVLARETYRLNINYKTYGKKFLILK